MTFVEELRGRFAIIQEISTYYVDRTDQLL
jgi:hypothetical protein